MGLISTSTSIGAGATVQNIWDGQIFEFVRGRQGMPRALRVGLTARFAAVAGDTTARVTVGSEVVADGYVIPVESALGAGPDMDRDMRIRDAALPGQRLSCSVTNTGVAAIVVDSLVEIL